MRLHVQNRIINMLQVPEMTRGVIACKRQKSAGDNRSTMARL